jgi:hypothetical protein
LPTLARERGKAPADLLAVGSISVERRGSKRALSVCGKGDHDSAVASADSRQTSNASLAHSFRFASPINLSARADIPMTMHSFSVLLMSIG